MSTSNRVDVIIASPEFQADFDEQVADALTELAERRAVEGTDVAPDPKRRIIVLAPTKAVGQEHAESLGIEPVAIVTTRSPHASYGIIADEIVETPELSTDVVAELLAHAAPSLATTEAD